MKRTASSIKALSAVCASQQKKHKNLWDPQALLLWKSFNPLARLVAVACQAGRWDGYRDWTKEVAALAEQLRPCLYCQRPGPHAHRCIHGRVCAQCFESHCVPSERLAEEDYYLPEDEDKEDEEGETGPRCHCCTLDLRGSPGVVSYVCADCLEEDGGANLLVTLRRVAAPAADEDAPDCENCGRGADEEDVAVYATHSCYPCHMGYFGALLDPKERAAHLAKLRLGPERHLTFRRYLLASHLMVTDRDMDTSDQEYVDNVLPHGSDWEASRSSGEESD